MGMLLRKAQIRKATTNASERVEPNPHLLLDGNAKGFSLGRRQPQLLAKPIY